MNHLTYLTFCAFFAFISGENCDKFGIRLYEDLACKPSKNGGPCPTSYECTLKPPNANQCLVQGKVYNAGDAIAKNSLGHGCEFGCFCRGASSVNCPRWGCGEWAGQPPLPAADCYRKYAEGSCCSSGIVCPPFNDTTICRVDEVDYKAGERFWPKDSCYACLCQKGFNGKFEEPYCRRSGCDAQVRNQEEIQKSCAPLYIKRSADGEKKCCPTTWTCPDGSEVIKIFGKKSDSTCKFGEKELQVGDSFEKEIQYNFRPLKIKCECKIPPLLFCTEN